MLSEMEASRLAFAESPATPAFSEEDKVIRYAFLLHQIILEATANASAINGRLTDKIRSISWPPVLCFIGVKVRFRSGYFALPSDLVLIIFDLHAPLPDESEPVSCHPIRVAALWCQPGNWTVPTPGYSPEQPDATGYDH